MKVLMIGFSVLLTFLMSVAANAQSCGYAFIYIRLTNAEDRPIREAQIELFNETASEDTHLKGGFTKLTWLDEKQQYLLSHGMCGEHFNAGVRISAKGFQTLERRIDVKFWFQSVDVKLMRAGTNEDEKFQIVPLPKNIEVESVRPFDPNLYKDWKKVELYNFSLYLPKEFKLEEFRGVDSGGWRYKAADLIFNISSGRLYDGPLESDKKRPGYKERFVLVNNVKVRMWFYEDKEPEGPFGDYPYTGHLTFKDLLSERNRFAVTLWSKDSNGLVLAEKIFESIRFK